jgi:hypothetical protein
MAPHLIETMGGAVLIENTFNRVKGGNEAGVQKFKENHAWELYCHQFNNPECIAGSCADYKSGATSEPKEQESDQKEGKKVKVPTFVIYSGTNLGRMHDVPAIWKDWCDGELKTFAMPGGIGHFIPEEDPDTTAKQVLEWIGHVGK